MIIGEHLEVKVSTMLEVKVSTMLEVKVSTMLEVKVNAMLESLVPNILSKKNHDNRKRDLKRLREINCVLLIENKKLGE